MSERKSDEQLYRMYTANRMIMEHVTYDEAQYYLKFYKAALQDVVIEPEEPDEK